MTSLALPLAPASGRRPLGGPALLVATALLAALLAAALARGLLLGRPLPAEFRPVVLAIHLATVIPAVPLGGWVLWGRKGTATHRLLGRLWALLMLTTALASFGLRFGGQLTWIHLFSILTLVSVPRAVWLAMRGRIAEHRAAIVRVYAGLVIAGFFTFLPSRMLGQWLFG